MALTPQDGEDMVFIPGTDRFAALLPHNRQYRGHGLKSLIVQETDRVASAPIIAPNEKDRLYDGGLKSSDFQDQEKDPVALPSYVADREAKNVKLPQQSDAMDKVLKCPAPPPSYEGLPNGTFSYGATWNILPNARGSPPKLAIAHKFEPPNNIHLRIQIQNCAYRVSELEFKINFCNGEIILLQSLKTDN
jgi:hypothetical protein